MPRVGFKPTIPVFERAKTFHALDRMATAVGVFKLKNEHKLQIFGNKMLRKEYLDSRGGNWSIWWYQDDIMTITAKGIKLSVYFNYEHRLWWKTEYFAVSRYHYDTKKKYTESFFTGIRGEII
jgi:hypothetical protein